MLTHGKESMLRRISRFTWGINCPNSRQNQLGVSNETGRFAFTGRDGLWGGSLIPFSGLASHVLFGYSRFPFDIPQIQACEKPAYSRFLGNAYSTEMMTCCFPYQIDPSTESMRKESCVENETLSAEPRKVRREKSPNTLAASHKSPQLPLSSPFSLKRVTPGCVCILFICFFFKANHRGNRSQCRFRATQQGSSFDGFWGFSKSIEWGLFP